MKKAIVTGASSGIGKAISEKLLKEGWSVVGIGRNFSEEAIRHEHFYPKKIDLSDLKPLPDRLKELHNEIGEVNAIIANAGRGHFGHLEEYSYEQIVSLINLNFLSHVFLIKAFLAEMKRRNDGEIIFIGSEAALEGKRKGSIYCASKFAVRGFSQALRDECSGNNIRVSLINPGMVDTPFFSSLNFKPGAAADEHIAPEDVAEVVSMVINSRKGTVFDEINLSPQKKKILWEKK